MNEDIIKNLKEMISDIYYNKSILNSTKSLIKIEGYNPSKHGKLDFVQIGDRTKNPISVFRGDTSDRFIAYSFAEALATAEKGFILENILKSNPNTIKLDTIDTNEILGQIFSSQDCFVFIPLKYLYSAEFMRDRWDYFDMQNEKIKFSGRSIPFIHSHNALPFDDIIIIERGALDIVQKSSGQMVPFGNQPEYLKSFNENDEKLQVLAGIDPKDPNYIELVLRLVYSIRVDGKKIKRIVIKQESDVATN